MPATAASPSVLFEDGLGKRHFTTGPAGDPLDVLVVSDELTVVPSFEAALRARPAQLATFQHAAFSRIRGLVRLGKAQRLGIVSDHVDGMRLSELLTVAERHLIPVPLDASVYLVRQLVTALAALHAAMSDTCHGAIAPERIVITPDAGIVVVDHVLGAALEQLRFSPERHWKELRIALPQTIGHPRFDEKTDLVQVGAVALALLLGRPLRNDEDPSVNRGLVSSARALGSNGELAPLPASLRAWLQKVLQQVPQRSFGTMSEALADLQAQTGLPGDEAGLAAFKTFVASCSAALIDEPATPPAESTAIVRVASVPPPAVAAATPASVAAGDEQESAPGTSLPAARDVVQPTGWWNAARVAQAKALVTHHTRAFAIGTAALVVMSLAGVAARMYASTPAPVASTGTLIVNTEPAGAAVVIDGRQRGMTPVTVALTSGEHVMVLGTDQDPRTVKLNIAPGAQLSQFYELPHAAPVHGQLQVRSDPPGAKVLVDGQNRGVAPLTVPDLAPGTHAVVLENEQGSVKEDVQVEAGATAALVVPMASPKAAAPTSGWIAVDSPGDLQLFENQQLLGTNKSDRIMLPPGSHTLDLVNDALGYRSSRTVQVNAGQGTRIKVDWPTGSLALNALPWADVWVDGQRVGQTPIGNVAVPIGVHDVVFRHPELGEQRFKATVTTGAPARLSADLRKK